MARYIEGFVIPVQKRRVSQYVKLARLVGKVWGEQGVKLTECIAVDVSWGKRTSFPRSVKLRKGEVVFLAWAEYKSRKHYDRAQAATMNDPRMKVFAESKSLPFDVKRMFFGAFKPLVET